MNKEFCIVSNNCWGGEVYKEFSMQFNTPFIGLFFAPDCFVKLCNNLHGYLSKEVIFIPKSKYPDYENASYPIGLLGDLEIHFVHYKDKEDALTKWKRRVERMPKDDSLIYVKADDRELINWESYISKWNTITFKKIFFSKRNELKINDLVWLYEYSKMPTIPDGKQLYKVSKNHINIQNWLDKKPYKKSKVASRIATTIFGLTPRRFR